MLDAEPAPPFASSAPLHVVLYQPEIAANTGSIGRTCVALGAALWLVRPLGFLLTDRHRRRAGLDYWDHLEHYLVDDLAEIRQALGHDRFWLFSTKAHQHVCNAVFQPGDALVFGPESRGLPESWLAASPDLSVKLPMRPEARSLNLAVAVGMGLFEASRQMRFP